jgi:EmrB/QacA subfamily drug resistance transporter
VTQRALEDPQVIHARRWWTLAVLCLSLVIIVASNSSLNVALPSLQRHLHASTSSLQWIVDAYSLVFAGLLLPAGALADRYGRKPALQFGLVVFGTASLAASFATATWELIVLRAITGAGAAFIMPGTLSILANVFPPHERGRAIAIWAGFSGLGAGIGPLASGLLLNNFSWGSVFLVNVPLVLLALVGGLFLVPNSRDPEHTALDPPGVALVVSGLAVLLYGIIEAPNRGWTESLTLVSLLVGVLLLGGFVAWELRSRHPMLDVRLFRIRSFAIGSGTIALQFFALFGMFFILTQYFQLAHLYSPLKAAAAGLPVALCIMVGAPMSARMVARFGPRRVVGVGLLVTASSFVLLSRVGPSTPYSEILVAEVLLGLGIGQTTAPSTTLIMNSVRMAKAGVGSAVNDTSRELGGALGVAVLGSVLNSVYQSRIKDALPPLTPPSVAAAAHGSVAGALTAANGLPPRLADAVTSAARSTFSEGFRAAVLVGAAMLVLTSGLVWVFQERSTVAPVDEPPGPTAAPAGAPPEGAAAPAPPPSGDGSGGQLDGGGVGAAALVDPADGDGVAGVVGADLGGQVRGTGHRVAVDRHDGVTGGQPG